VSVRDAIRVARACLGPCLGLADGAEAAGAGGMWARLEEAIAAEAGGGGCLADHRIVEMLVGARGEAQDAFRRGLRLSFPRVPTPLCKVTPGSSYTGLYPQNPR